MHTGNQLLQRHPRRLLVQVEDQLATTDDSSNAMTHALQVETTMTKGVFRVVTTAVGGALAVAVMARPAVAASPYVLSAIVLAFDFVVCLWMASQFKYAGEGFCKLVTSSSAWHM